MSNVCYKEPERCRWLDEVAREGFSAEVALWLLASCFSLRKQQLQVSWGGRCLQEPHGGQRGSGSLGWRKTGREQGQKGSQEPDPWQDFELFPFEVEPLAGFELESGQMRLCVKHKPGCFMEKTVWRQCGYRQQLSAFPSRRVCVWGGGDVHKYTGASRCIKGIFVCM